MSKLFKFMVIVAVALINSSCVQNKPYEKKSPCVGVDDPNNPYVKSPCVKRPINFYLEIS